ncbi:MAG: hemolysin III family protein [Elusimicrobia bacterium]|nr:hemolysin III family protein [Elusimicrobiota bacterium]
MRDEAPPERPQSLGEEIANSISHGAGALLAAAATPILILHAVRHGSAINVVGATVFAVSLLALYLGSALYHSLPRGRAKQVFQLLEHSAIFLLIAGTYTPFTLGVLRGPWGWTLLAVIWTLAAVGIGLKVIGGAEAFPAISTLLYLFMGWVVIAAIRPLWLHMPHAGFLWLVVGGLAYTAGVLFFIAERMPYGHFVWHLFVLIGSTCHFFAALYYAA